MSKNNIAGTVNNYKDISGNITGTVSDKSQISGNIMATVLKGLSAYEVAVKSGFVGTEEEWLQSLVGNGIDSMSMNPDGFLTIIYTNGDSYTTPISLKGRDGHSPYVGQNNNWFVYDDSRDEYIDSGIVATFAVGDGLKVDAQTGQVSVDSTDDVAEDNNKPVTSKGVALVSKEIKDTLSEKVDKVDGKGLSTNDYTSNEKTKLANVADGAQVNVLEGIQKNGIDVEITNKIANITVPTNTNELTNGAGFQTASDVTAAIESALANISGFEYSIVESLPATGEKGTIYLIAHTHGDRDIYDEYIYVSSGWEKIGNTDIDLSGYIEDSDMVAITLSEIDAICV